MVEEPPCPRHRFLQGAGEHRRVINEEILAGTDHLEGLDDPYTHREPRREAREARDQEETRHFPHLENAPSDNISNHLSVQHLDAITLATTRRSTRPDRYWICQPRDPTNQGKAVYRILRQAYPDHRVTLQNWLNT